MNNRAHDESDGTVISKLKPKRKCAAVPEFAAVSESTPMFVQIVSQLIKAIEEGRLLLGSRLPSELVLSKQFGVSRASVREALSCLQFAGYIESRRGSGSVVCSTVARGTGKLWEAGLIGPVNIVDVIEARLAVEPETIRQAALNPVLSAHSTLIKLLEGMELSLGHPEFNARTDIGIHLALVKTCPNPFLAQLSEQLLTYSEGHLWRSIRDRAWDEGKLPRTWLGHHEMIARAVMERNPDHAEAGMKMHLLSVLENVASADGLTPEDRRRAGEIHERYSAELNKASF